MLDQTTPEADSLVLARSGRRGDVRIASYRVRRAGDDGGRRHRRRSRRVAAVGRQPAAPLTVSVLIPAHNEAETIGRTVRSVIEQTYRPSVVFVIDDGSTDETAELARIAGATVISAKCGGKAKALNLALQYVTTDLVIGVDADTILAPDAIEHMVATIESGYDGTCGAVLPRPDQRRSLTVRARWVQYAIMRHWGRPVQSMLGRLNVLSGAAFCYTTEALRSIGGIPVVPIGEDTNLTWRLQRAGYRLGFTKAAVAYTTEPETMRAYIAQIRRWASSTAQVISGNKLALGHPGRAVIIGMWLWDLLGVQVTLALALLIAAHRGPTVLVGMGGVQALAYAISLGVTIRALGIRETIKCYPASVLIGWITRWIYIWALVREWVFGRHYTSWTGRQNRPASVTPMSVERRYVFASFASLGGLWAAFTSFGTELAAASALLAVGVTGFLLTRASDASA